MKGKKGWRSKAAGREYGPADKRWAKNPEAMKRRAELNREARKRGIYGKRRKKGKDLSHTKDGKMVLENASTNRSRNGKGGKSRRK